MSDIANLVQVAVRAVLVADAPLIAALGGDLILDEVPDNQPPPYVQFGRIEPARTDTDGCLAWEVTLGLEVYTRPGAGRVSAQTLCALVSAAMHRKPDLFEVPGWAVWEVESDTFTVARQSDGKTYRGTVAAVISLSAA